MKSYEYADKLQELAYFLRSKPEFDTGGDPYFYSHHYTKESFIAAVRALGAGTKKFSSTEITFTITGAPVSMAIFAPRDKVCTLVTPAVWDCEPLLSVSELEEVGK